MRRRDPRYQCWVCKKRYALDQLGRMNLPMWLSRKGLRTTRIVCVACSTAVCDSLVGMGRGDLAVVHGA